jgi:ATPase subunit of ABC transporter with duplicated ATPase domains
MNHYAIRIEQLSKQYKIGRSLRKENLTDTLRADLSEMVDGAARALAKVAGQNEPEPQGRRQTIWALNDVSFDIQPGESVGVIGSNGAGENHFAETDLSHHGADQRTHPPAWAGGFFAGSGHRVSHRVDRAGKHLFEWRHSGDASP